ncbi:TfoX/Sxy family protein [Streptomyces sp. NPDC096132]|uniref:TfoX/Sxy family protein n=1 Tax=Streptomyces sp. NPDC096132 TaxID=3366075 RepID=UPI00380CAE1F
MTTDVTARRLAEQSGTEVSCGWCTTKGWRSGSGSGWGLIRERLGADPAVAEKRMFGGIAFLVHGNMAVGVTGHDLMVRVGPDATDAALARPGARLFDMTGRPMRGWVVVDGAAVTEDETLGAWVAEGGAFAASLPPK